MPAGVLSLLAFFLLLFLLPFLLANVMLQALALLGINVWLALAIVLGIFLGSLINIPVYRSPQSYVIEYRSVSMFGIDQFIPRRSRRVFYRIIAMNVGGCVIPAAIVVYECIRLLGMGWSVVSAGAVAIGCNIVLCYLLARPITGLGITLPALAPGLAAALLALMLTPEHAPIVAFCAGVLGPLIGADLLHLREVKSRNVGVLSIGGAGTFDGIVLSGFIATLLGS